MPLLQRGNMATNLPDASTAEIIETLSTMAGGAVRIERIVSEEQFSPPGFWYDQAWDEWVLILRGGATLTFDEPAATEHLAEHDWLLIPAHRKHRVSSTLPSTLWLAIHADSRDEPGTESGLTH